MTTSSYLISTEANPNDPTRQDHGAEPSVESFLAHDGSLGWQDSLERWLLDGGDEAPASLETAIELSVDDPGISLHAAVEPPLPPPRDEASIEVIESLELSGLELSSLDVLMDELERRPSRLQAAGTTDLPETQPKRPSWRTGPPPAPPHRKSGPPSERHPDSARSPLLALAHMHAMAQRGQDAGDLEPAPPVSQRAETPAPSVVPLARSSAGSTQKRGSARPVWRAGRWSTLGYVVAVAAVAAGGAAIAAQDRGGAEPPARLQSASPRWEQLGATLRSAAQLAPKPERGRAEHQDGAPTEGVSTDASSHAPARLAAGAISSRALPTARATGWVPPPDTMAGPVRPSMDQAPNTSPGSSSKPSAATASTNDPYGTTDTEPPEAPSADDADGQAPAPQATDGGGEGSGLRFPAEL